MITNIREELAGGCLEYHIIGENQPSWNYGYLSWLGISHFWMLSDLIRDDIIEYID